jgi:hypothetical protein
MHRMSCLLFCLSLSLVVAPDTARRPHVARRELASVVDKGGPLPDADTMARLAKTDPVAFLEWALIRYDREVKGYSCLLIKQERLHGELHPREKIEVLFREKPFSVFMAWKEGSKALTAPERVLYVEGENDGMLLAKVRLLPSPVKKDPLGEEALRSGRYPITEFGMKVGTRRALTSWKDAQNDPKAQGPLQVEFGEKEVKELGRTCYALRRFGYTHKYADGAVEVESTLYFDRETWLQVGSVLKGRDGELIGEFLFKDVRLNPPFKDDAFSKKAVAGG